MQPDLKDFEFCNAYPELDTVNIMGGGCMIKSVMELVSKKIVLLQQNG